MLIRDLPAELGGPADWRDAITPYGYPCPLHSEDSPKLAGALAALRETGREQGLVTIFFRLHPLLPLQPDDLLRAQGTLLQHSSTVTIDLTLPPETQWSQIRKGHRYEIRKLAADGFTAAMDDWSRLDDFFYMYLSTMFQSTPASFTTSARLISRSCAENSATACTWGPSTRPTATWPARGWSRSFRTT
jgi:hypothetical protein